MTRARSTKLVLSAAAGVVFVVVTLMRPSYGAFVVSIGTQNSTTEMQGNDSTTTSGDDMERRQDAGNVSDVDASYNTPNLQHWEKSTKDMVVDKKNGTDLQIRQNAGAASDDASHNTSNSDHREKNTIKISPDKKNGTDTQVRQKGIVSTVDMSHHWNNTPNNNTSNGGHGEENTVKKTTDEKNDIAEEQLDEYGKPGGQTPLMGNTFHALAALHSYLHAIHDTQNLKNGTNTTTTTGLSKISSNKKSSPKFSIGNIVYSVWGSLLGGALIFFSLSDTFRLPVIHILDSLLGSQRQRRGASRVGLESYVSQIFNALILAMDKIEEIQRVA